jgi:hypothetical protein
MGGAGRNVGKVVWWMERSCRVRVGESGVDKTAWDGRR